MKYGLEPIAAADWAALTQLNEGWSGWQWIWADLGGIQIATGLPAEAPFTTCLWGWSDGRWARIRIDPAPGSGLAIVGAVLTAGASAGRPVDVLESTVPSFTSSSSRGPGRDVLSSSTVQTLEVMVPALTFVKVLAS